MRSASPPASERTRKRPSAGPSRKPNSSWTKPNGEEAAGGEAYSPRCASDARLVFLTGIAYFEGLVGTTGLSILRSWSMQV